MQLTRPCNAADITGPETPEQQAYVWLWAVMYLAEYGAKSNIPMNEEATKGNTGGTDANKRYRNRK